MKLYIVRDQIEVKGLLEGILAGGKLGVAFELKAKVELTQEERELVKKYKADQEVLLKKELKSIFSEKPLVINITIGSLIKGETFKCFDIGTILSYEESLKEACRNFKNYLEVMKKFGGEEVIEY